MEGADGFGLGDRAFGARPGRIGTRDFRFRYAVVRAQNTPNVRGREPNILESLLGALRAQDGKEAAGWL